MGAHHIYPMYLKIFTLRFRHREYKQNSHNDNNNDDDMITTMKIIITIVVVVVITISNTYHNYNKRKEPSHAQ